MKIVVLGAGAVGMVMGGLLAQNNHRVCLLGREEHISAINRNGLLITGSWGDHQVGGVKGYTDLSELKDQEEGEDGFDLGLLTVKTYDTQTVVQQLCDSFPDTFPLLVFQKGLGKIEQVVALRGKETIIAGSVGFTAETVAQGTVTVTAVNEKTRIGGLKDGTPRTVVNEAADLLSGAGIPTLPATDIETVLWNGALFGCALDGLATVLGVDYGFLGEQEEARHLVSSIVGEFFAVSEKEARKTDWPDPETYLRELFAVMIPARSTQFPPMLRQIQDGKGTEIDALNGAVVEMALSHGIDVPINWLIWQLVNAKQKMASGKREA